MSLAVIVETTRHWVAIPFGKLLNFLLWELVQHGSSTAWWLEMALTTSICLWGNGRVPSRTARKRRGYLDAADPSPKPVCAAYLIILVLFLVYSHNMFDGFVPACCCGWLKWGGTIVKTLLESFCFDCEEFLMLVLESTDFPLVGTQFPVADQVPDAFWGGAVRFNSRSADPLRLFGSVFLLDASTSVFCA